MNKILAQAGYLVQIYWTFFFLYYESTCSIEKTFKCNQKVIISYPDKIKSLVCSSKAWSLSLLIHRIQVLSNSGLAAILAIVAAVLTSGEDKCLDATKSNVVTGLVGGIIGHYSCCNGDTWSSELGILSNAQPRLITNFKVQMCANILRVVGIVVRAVTKYNLSLWLGTCP